MDTSTIQVGDTLTLGWESESGADIDGDFVVQSPITATVIRAKRALYTGEESSRGEIVVIERKTGLEHELPRNHPRALTHPPRRILAVAPA